ncbi:hypothetical protein JXA56_01200 [Candidatus Micrarchaeota archaeon]|nr:hypothetical protein [Candidatus Micrarchaeota archaeon]
MKAFVLLIVALGMLVVPAFAENSEENVNVTNDELDIIINESEVGTLPGEFTYGFKRFFENVDKFFTFDKAEKARKHAKYGMLRAVEAHVLSGKAQKFAAQGDQAGLNQTLRLIEQATTEQNEENQAAQNAIEEAVDEGSADEEDVQQVQNEVRNSIRVLQRVYEKVPAQAKEGVLNALNNSIMNQERHMERMQEREGKMTQERPGEKEDKNQSETQNRTQEQIHNQTQNKTGGQDEIPGKGIGRPGNEAENESEDEE